MTEYAVLGLLSFGPASGYELDRLAGRSIDYFWRPARSKIYAVLPRLVQHGLATSQQVEQDGRPDKHVYALTGAGCEALRAWLDDDEPAPTVVRSEPLLKLFFAGAADQERVRRTLVRWRERARGQLAALREIEATIDAEARFFPYLTLLHGIEDAQSTVRWVTRALELGHLPPQRLGVKGNHEPSAAGL